MLRYGGAGRHTVALNPSVVIRCVKLDNAAATLYNFSILFPKLTILNLYARIFSTRPYRYAIYSVGSIMILTCIAGQIVILTLCRPYAYSWDKSIPNGSCGDIPAAYRYISLPNLLTDFCILVLPLHGVWRLHLETINKIGLSCVFLLGCM